MWCIINDENDQTQIDADTAKALTTEIDGIITQIKSDSTMPIEKVKELCDQVTDKAKQIDEIVAKYLK